MEVSRLVTSEENPITLDRLAHDRFSKQAVDRYTLKLNRLAAVLLKLANKYVILPAVDSILACAADGTQRVRGGKKVGRGTSAPPPGRRDSQDREAKSGLKEAGSRTVAQSGLPGEEKTLLKERFQRIKAGVKVKKYNFGSNGFHVKFVKVVDGNKLVWCDKETDANNPKKRKERDLATARALFYGPVSDVWVENQGKRNKKAIEVASQSPWTCISILFEDRTLDLYFEDPLEAQKKDQDYDETDVTTGQDLDNWYLGLSYVVQKLNPDVWRLTMGQYFWRKCKFLFVGWYIAEKGKNAKVDARGVRPSYAMLKYFKKEVEPALIKEKLVRYSKLK